MFDLVRAGWLVCYFIASRAWECFLNVLFKDQASLGRGFDLKFFEKCNIQICLYERHCMGAA